MLQASQLYLPPSSVLACVIIHQAPLEGTATPFLNHLNEGAGFPLAEQVKAAHCPFLTVVGLTVTITSLGASAAKEGKTRQEEKEKIKLFHENALYLL